MKSPRFFLWIFLATLAAVVLVHAADPAVEIGVDNGRTNVVEGLKRALYSTKLVSPDTLTADKQLTPWTDALTITLPATNRGQIVMLAETNEVLRTVGFSIPLNTSAALPQNLSGKVFIRLLP